MKHVEFTAVVVDYPASIREEMQEVLHEIERLQQATTYSQRKSIINDLYIEAFDCLGYMPVYYNDKLSHFSPANSWGLVHKAFKEILDMKILNILIRSIVAKDGTGYIAPVHRVALANWQHKNAQRRRPPISLEDIAKSWKTFIADFYDEERDNI